MRTIKFRGKRVDDGKWHYGFLTQNNGKSWIGAFAFDNYYFVEVHTETVGQFTGLLDKDGKEIYEGDVLKPHKTHADWADDLFSVFFEDGCFQMKNKYGRVAFYKFFLDAYNEDVIESFDDYSVLLEVVGNVHDNPELL